MKKFFSLVILICYSFLITVFSFETVECLKKTELKKIGSSESRIVGTSLISNEEQALLDVNLKRNANVLLLYCETEKEINSEIEQLIIEKYTNETVPYVIFVYNPNKQTLKTVSSSKEILEFTDISEQNVTSYTEVYKYIPRIKSKLAVPYASQNKGELILCICMIIIYFILIISIISIFCKILKYNFYWQDENDSGYLYKEGFFEKGYKVKINPNARDLIAIYTNVPAVEGKNYVYIPDKDKNNTKNKIVIETVTKVSVYLACDCFLNGFLKLIEYDKNDRFDSSRIQELKLDYKYCIENKNDDETEIESEKL